MQAEPKNQAAKTIISIVALPLLLLALSLYLPDLYGCTRLEVGTPEAFLVQVQCLQNTASYQQIMLIGAGMITIIMMIATVYKRKKSLSEQHKQEGK